MDVQLLSLGGFGLMAAFFFAGMIDSISGGGGLITIPSMMAFGVPTHNLTGTSQCSCGLGALTSVIKYLKSGNIRMNLAIIAAPAAAIASILGAKANLLVPAGILQTLMLFLVPVIAVIMLIKRDFGSEDHLDDFSLNRQRAMILAIAVGIGFYQGFYGPGAGTFSIMLMSMCMKMKLVQASANTRIVTTCAMLCAAVTYALSGTVLWAIAIPGTLFNIVGSYVGTCLAVTKGAKVIRPIFFLVLVLLFARLLTTYLA